MSRRAWKEPQLKLHSNTSFGKSLHDAASTAAAAIIDGRCLTISISAFKTRQFEKGSSRTDAQTSESWSQSMEVLNFYSLSNTSGYTEDKSDSLRDNVILERTVAQFGDKEMEKKERGDWFHSPLECLQHEKLHALDNFAPKAVIFHVELR